MANTGQHALYRYFDTQDRLLYVGISGSLATRNSSHVRRSLWMQFAARSTIERCDTPAKARGAERLAIETEGPVFNLQYNDSPEARERLTAYLDEAGSPDLLPVRLRAVAFPVRMIEWSAVLDADADLLDLLRQILTAPTADHAGVRLRALAAIHGHADLPRGLELDRIAKLASVGRGTAYQAKKALLPASTPVSGLPRTSDTPRKSPVGGLNREAS
jgi:hypothetical protein